MKKALIVTTVSGFVPQFEMNNIRILQALGYEVHYASNYNTPSYGTDNKRLEGTGIIQHQIDFVRSPFDIIHNVKVYKQLKKLMIETKFDLLHCHTPMGAALARFVAKKTNTKNVLYTAHGFHFYKGASLLNWLIYYPAEWYLSKYTDVLITINKEDYERARKLRSKQVKYIPGVGIDLTQVEEKMVNPAEIRKNLGVKEDTILILSVGELIKRKNFETALKVIANMKKDNIAYLICGHGILQDKLALLADELGIKDKVIFTGYRADIIDIIKSSDIFFFPSYQEGLSMALMEAMACGLPVVCSKIRGNIDLMEHSKGGYMYRPEDVNNLTKAICILQEQKYLRQEFGDYNKKAIEKYSKDNINHIMTQIYNDISQYKNK